MPLVLKFLLAVMGLVAIAAAALMIFGPARIWVLFGPADLGLVAFETLKRRATPNDALACPAGLCTARSDRAPPVFAVDVNTLRAAMAAIVAGGARIQSVSADDAPPTDRYIQRSALLGFPDTIVVRYLALPEGRSTLAIYSRSQLGRSDLGVNLARIDRWLARLQRDVPVADMPSAR